MYLEQHLFLFTVMIIVNATGSGTDGQGNAITTSTLTAYGYDNATAGGNGAEEYLTGALSTSTDPAYDVCKLSMSEL